MGELQTGSSATPPSLVLEDIHCQRTGNFTEPHVEAVSFKIMGLTAEQIQELCGTLEVRFETHGVVSSKFLDRMEPPSFSGRSED